MRKFSLILLLLTFIVLLISIVGMNTPYEDFFKQLHPVAGGTFIALIFTHLFFNRLPLKMMVFKKKAATGEQNGKNIHNNPPL